MNDQTVLTAANDQTDIIPDLKAMTSAEIAAWAEWSPPPKPLKIFPLDTETGRKQFLHELYWIGYDALFEGVNHVWNSLIAPRGYRCTLMGVHSGAGGSGKAALYNTLKQFIGEAIDTLQLIPPTENFESLEDWHNASMATYVDEERDLQVVIAKYETILSGSAPGGGKA
jgi:hypothetical protein